MRVEEPMLSMVATRRRADRRSGASEPKARQTPLNSSILAMRFRISGVIWRVSVVSMNQYYTNLHPFTPRRPIAYLRSVYLFIGLASGFLFTDAVGNPF